MASIEVRPLRPGQEKVWLGVGLSVAAVRASLPEFTERVRRRRTDERAFLLAFDGPRCVGRLEGTFLNPTLYFVRELYAPDGPDASRIEEALCGYLRASFARDRIVVLTWDAPENDALLAALQRTGFRVAKRKAFVERSLEGYVSPYEDPFTYAPLDEVGRTAFVRLMNDASEGDPFEDAAGRDAEREFQELIDYAGERFDPAWWQIASLGRDRAGVVLPQVFPNAADEGTLFYVALLPAFRGRGYGKVLHAAGLAFLAARGVKKYVGSTDTRNAPMVAVFAANGCTRSATQLFLEATG